MTKTVGVVAGKYEDCDGESIENVKFCDDYPSVLEALQAVKSRSLHTYHFCYLERNGERFEASELMNKVEALLPTGTHI